MVKQEKVEIVTSHTYTRYIRVPAHIIRALEKAGFKLSQEVSIDVDTKKMNPHNPFAWNLTVKPVSGPDPDYSKIKKAVDNPH